MPDQWDIIGIIGAFAISAGAGFIYPPLFLIVGGAFILAAYILKGLSDVPNPSGPGDSDELPALRDDGRDGPV